MLHAPPCAVQVKGLQSEYTRLVDSGNGGGGGVKAAQPAEPSAAGSGELPPAEVVDMEVERLERDAVPEALPPIPVLPRVPTRERMRAVTSPDAVVKEFADDPRTGVVPLEYQDTAVKPEDDDD